MNNIMELLQHSLESTNINEQMKEFLDSCLENGVFYIQENAETIVKLINTNINSSFEREKGLLLLLTFLHQISVEVFSNNALPWMLHCSKFLFQSCGIIDTLSIKALTKLIKLSVKFPEVNKETAKQIIPKFLLDNVKRKTNTPVSVELLDCLHVCMSEYPGPSGEFKSDILKLLLRTVESKPIVVGAAAQCVPLLARVGGGGKQGGSHKTSWHQQQLSLISMLHILLNKIYEHVDCLMIPESTLQDDLLELEPVNEKNVLLKNQRLATQFSSVAQFLQAMLLEEFSVVKSIAPNAILDVINHAQKPTHASLGPSLEAQAILSVLPSVQIAALRILESLVLCLGRNIVPLGSQVCFLCTQMIIWTHQQNTDWPYAMDKSFSNTRLAAYCCLYSWLTTVGAACNMDMLVEKVLPVMLSDIYAEKPTVRLRVGSKTGKGKRKQHMLVNEEDRSEKLSNPKANNQLCERSLKVLDQMVRINVSTLNQETYRSITSTVLKLATDLPVPYSDTNCYCALYKLLLTLCIQPHPFTAPPLAPAIALFTSGLHHPNPQVKATCMSALSNLGRMVRPIARTLYFPLPQEKSKLSTDCLEENDTGDQNDKMSKKRKIYDINFPDYLMAEDSDSRISTISLSGTQESHLQRKVAMEVSDSSDEIVEILSGNNEPESYNKDKDTKKIDEDIENINAETYCIDSVDSNKTNIVPREVKELTSDCTISVESNKSNIVSQEIKELSSIKMDDKSQETKTIIFNTTNEPTMVVLNNGSTNNVIDITLPESKDSDVVDMLMDFQDEVCSGTES